MNFGRNRRLRTVCFVVFSLSTLPGMRAMAGPALNVVLQTDFGKQDGAVSALNAVIDRVNPNIKVNEVTHEIPPFDIFTAAFRLAQASQFWRPGTVFVSVVDPGVGTSRRSIVAKTALDHYFVTPDNGTLTLIHEIEKITEVRLIDTKHRLPGSEHSHTFHGRDVYAFVAAKLAAGELQWEEVGELTPVETLVQLPKPEAKILDGVLVGSIPALDVRFGNVWSNIPEALATEFGLRLGQEYQVTISHRGTEVFSRKLPFKRTFGEVSDYEHVLYLNSLGNLACGISLASLADQAKIKYGPDWTFEVRK